MDSRIPQGTFDISELMKDSSISMNVRQEFIVTTADKIKLCMIKHSVALANKRAWISPAGIAVTLVAAIVTSNFKRALWLDAQTWQAAFCLVLLASLAWLVVAVIRAGRAGGHTVADIVRELRSSSVDGD
jgi:hypothetical protein